MRLRMLMFRPGEGIVAYLRYTRQQDCEYGFRDTDIGCLAVIGARREALRWLLLVNSVG